MMQQMRKHSCEERQKSTHIEVLALTARALFMVALDALVVATALRTIRLNLGASVEQLE